MTHSVLLHHVRKLYTGGDGAESTIVNITTSIFRHFKEIPIQRDDSITCGAVIRKPNQV